MKISLIAKDLREKLLVTLKRFPFAVFYLLLFNFIVIAEINGFNDDWPNEVNLFFLWGGSVGSLLSVSLKLWHEAYALKRLYKNIIFGAVQFIHLLISFMLALWMDDLSQIHVIAMASGVFMVMVSIYTLPFFKQKTDLPHWCFITALCRASAIAILSGMIMCAGIWLLFLSFDQLFDLSLSDDFKLSATALCFVLLSPIVFMAFIPVGEEMFKSEVTPANYVVKFTHYLILPLLGLYLLVLYLYAFKILFTWELPNGWVSWLVTVSVLGMVFIEFLLYPRLFDEGNLFDKRLLKLLPIIVMPMLVLMSIGMIRRFYDYGITVKRLYLLLFNLWCYGVCIGLIVTRSRRISWISISFAAAFAMTSIWPVNFSTITRFVLHHQIETAMRNDHLELPLNQNAYHQWLNQQDKPASALIVSKINYIDSQFRRKDLDDLIDRKVSLFYASNNSIQNELPILESYSYHNDKEDYDLLPDIRYSRLRALSYLDSESMILENNRIVIKIIDKDRDNHDEVLEFLLPLDKLQNDEHDDKKADADIILHHPKADLYIHDMRLECRIEKEPHDKKTSKSVDSTQFRGILMFRDSH